MKDEKVSKKEVEFFEEYLMTTFEDKMWDEAQEMVDLENMRSMGYRRL